MALTGAADNVLVAVGITVLVVRQFVWRSADPARMLKLPCGVLAVGLAYLVAELSDRPRWHGADWLLPVELALVAVTGTVMGHVTRFRRVDTGWQYRLTGPGAALWAVFVAIRIGALCLAAVLGGTLAAATGPVLISFGVNRLCAVLVVRRRSLALVEASREPAVPA